MLRQFVCPLNSARTFSNKSSRLTVCSHIPIFWIACVFKHSPKKHFHSVRRFFFRTLISSPRTRAPVENTESFFHQAWPTVKHPQLTPGCRYSLAQLTFIFNESSHLSLYEPHTWQLDESKLTGLTRKPGDDSISFARRSAGIVPHYVAH